MDNKNRKSNKLRTGIIGIGVPVLLSVLFIFGLYLVAPHRTGGFTNVPVSWSFIDLTDNTPCTYDEKAPYISTYAISIDNKNKCACIYFTIKGNNKLIAPYREITMAVNGTEHAVYEAPFEDHKEVENQISAYLQEIKDKSPVFTYKAYEESLSLCVIFPMKGDLKDPGYINTASFGLKGIYDETGNEIISGEAHSDWIFDADRNGRVVPRRNVISCDTRQLYTMQEGDTVHVYISPSDNVSLYDIETYESAGEVITGSLEFSGFDAISDWSLGKDAAGDEQMILTFYNVRNIEDDISITIPANLADGWIDGVYFTSNTETINICRNNDTEENAND